MPDISLLGATYSDVPAVTLPRSGDGNATFSYVDPDPATAAMTQSVGVDGNGKLWTAPGGGGSEMELIFDVTTTEDANAITINVDSNGQPFSLKSVRFFLEAPTTFPAGTSYLAFSSNAKRFFTFGNNSGSIPLRLTAEFFSIDAPLLLNFIKRSNYYTTYEVSGNDETGPISIVRLYNFSSLTYPAGTRLMMYGVRQ